MRLKLSNGIEVDASVVWGLDGVNGLTVLLDIHDFYPEVKRIWVEREHTSKSGRAVSTTLYMKRLSAIDGRPEDHAVTACVNGLSVNFLEPDRGQRV